jgi:hypothetical protein
MCTPAGNCCQQKLQGELHGVPGGWRSTSSPRRLRIAAAMKFPAAAEKQATVHKLDVSLIEAATSSFFEALKQYSLGERALKEKGPATLPYRQPAIELDPKTLLWATEQWGRPPRARSSGRMSISPKLSSYGNTAHSHWERWQKAEGACRPHDGGIPPIASGNQSEPHRWMNREHLYPSKRN